MNRRTSSPSVHIESLESRRLLAITIDSGGIVHATGTGGNDVIRIDPVSGQYRVAVNSEVQSFNSITGFVFDGLAGHDWLLDTIPYTPGPNYLSRTMSGGDGNDNFWEVTPGDNAATISGGAGDDTVHHGQAIYHIRFDGGAGRDTLRSATPERVFVDLADFPTVEDAFIERGSLDGNALGNRLVVANGEGFTVRGNGGNDSLEIVAGSGWIEGGDGNDSLVGGPGRETLDGGAGNDTLRGNGGDDTLYGRAGFDLLDAGAGDDHLFGFGDGAVDTLLGGAGYDRASRDAGDSVSAIEEFVSQGAAYISGGVLTVDGSAGNDRITILDDSIGAVILITVNGFEYSFEYSYDYEQGHPAEFSSILARGFDGNDEFDVVVSRLRIEGGDGNDTIRHYQEALDPTVVGGNGDDTVIYSAPGGVSSTGPFEGGPGRDAWVLESYGNVDLRDYPTVENATTQQGTLTGNSLNNRLTITQYGGIARGGDGNDTLDGSGSSEGVELFGENGNDTLIGGGGADLFQGGGGVDTLDYSSRTVNLSITLGTTANDGATGEGDNAWFDIETVNGGAGNDFISATGSNNVLRGNGGNDLLRSFGGNDALFGGSGNDRLEAGTGNDYLEGNAGNDALFGEAGTDFYLGHDGDDWIYARDGIGETVNGGAGFDRAQRDPSDAVLSIEAFLA